MVCDSGHGANWARNMGFKGINTELVLFSDNDIEWAENGVSALLEALDEHPEASYSYGSYMMGNNLYCNQNFDPEKLKQYNYISTMSLVRVKDFPGFDEKIERFQDWDLWLTMLEQGKVGVHCGEIIFKTEIKDGITHNGKVDVLEAQRIIKEKHSL